MASGDQIATFNHNPNAPLGRIGAGLRVGEDERGGWYEVDLPDTSTGRDVAELVRRGVLSGSSFVFTVADHQADQTWTRDEATGDLIRTVTRFGAIPELGPVLTPAYPDTTVALRARERAEALLPSPALPSERGPALTVTAPVVEPAEDRARVEHQLQSAADEGRPDAEARLLAALDKLDILVERRSAEQLAAQAETESRDLLLSLLDQHRATPDRADAAVDEIAELRALGLGERGPLELRATLGVNVDATNKQTGKATPARTLYRRLTDLMGERSFVVSGGAETLTTTGAEAIDFPRVKPADAPEAPVPEAGAFTESYPSTDKVEVGAAKRGYISWLSWELVNDDVVDLVGYLVRTAGPNLAYMYNRVHVANLLSQVDPTLVEDESAATAPPDDVVADWVIDLSLAIPSSAEANARWVTGRKVVRKLRKLKDREGRYLLRSLDEGSSLTLAGRPLVREVAMDSRSDLLFSDLTGYVVRRAGTLRVEKTTDAKFTSDEIGFKFALREGGGLVDPTGTALLKLPEVL
ncbi:HK97 family phage major capsid protein/HK97 family phage prohead protease [Actinokineospora baliensis]|nr:HK97 family phage major capsid protein/HK97 family phage prohead protease [Actinokineospora baliensis]